MLSVSARVHCVPRAPGQSDVPLGANTIVDVYVPKQRPLEECNPPKPKEEIHAVSFLGGVRWTLSGKCPTARISSWQALKTRRHKEVICGKEPKWDLSRGWQLPGGVECAVLGASGFAAAGVPQHTVWEPPSLEPQGLSSPEPQFPL